MRSVRCSTPAETAEARPRRAIAGIDLDLLAGLRILERDNADIRQLLFAPILNVERNEIVTTPADGKLPREIRRLEIRDEKHDRAPCHDLVEIVQGQGRGRPRPLRLEE